jgi:hypothetical protein
MKLGGLASELNISSMSALVSPRAGATDGRADGGVWESKSDSGVSIIVEFADVVEDGLVTPFDEGVANDCEFGKFGGARRSIVKERKSSC